MKYNNKVDSCSLLEGYREWVLLSHQMVSTVFSTPSRWVPNMLMLKSPFVAVCKKELVLSDLLILC